MKRLLVLLALSVVLAAILLPRSPDVEAVPELSAEPATPPKEPVRPVTHRAITAKDRYGSPVTLRTSEADMVVMATWCRYSQELKGFLTDPAVRPHVAGRRLVFLFEVSEWPRLQRRMVENRQASPEEATRVIAIRQQQQRGSPFANESFLRGLPGEIYFVADADALGMSGFPAFYSAVTARFDLGRANWAVQHVGMPGQLVRDLLAKHAVP